MAKENNQIGSSWEDLALPKEFPEPYTEERAEQNEEAAEDTVASDTEENIGIHTSTLLRMLKAAESRWTPQTRDRDKTEPSELEPKATETEALKTNMVSKESYFFVACIYSNTAP